MFQCLAPDVYFFRRLISEVALPNFATRLVVIQIYKIGPDTWGSIPQKLAGQNIKISATLLRFDREYLRTATRCHQSENGVENYDHSINLLNYGHKERKIEPPKTTFSEAHLWALMDAPLKFHKW